MFRMMTAAIAGLALAGPAAALDVEFTQESVPTPGLDGFTTWTVTANDLNAGNINGFDVTITADLVNQVNPLGLPTIYQHSNAAFPAVSADPLQDTQFLFDTSTEVLILPAGFQFESGTGIRGVFVITNDLAGPSVPFLQIVLPTGGTAELTGTLAAPTGIEDPVAFTIGGGATPLVGDLNGDGFVGAGDLDILLGVWNQNDSGVADLNGDGFIGAGDLDILLGNWNAGTAPGGSAGVVPEPASLTLLAVAAGALALRRRG